MGGSVQLSWTSGVERELELEQGLGSGPGAVAMGALEVLCTGIVSQPDGKQQPARQEEHVGQGHSAT